MLNELHTFIRNTIRKKRSGFATPEAITDAINRASIDLWRELIEKERETGIPSTQLQPFHFKDSDTTASGTDGLYTYELAQYFSNTSVDYEVMSATVDGNKPCQLYLGERAWAERFDAPLLENYRHFRIKRYSITLTTSDSGRVDLPAYFKRDLGVIYFKDAFNNLYEGEILPHNEFLDRVRSTILAPDTENPVATIYGGQVEIYPAPASGTYTYEMPYEAYTTVDYPVARVYAGASGIELLVEPSGANLEITIAGYKPPNTAAATYSYASGEVSLSVSTDLNWNDNAFSLIARRALMYLGFSLPDDRTIQLDQVATQSDQSFRV